MHDAVAATYQLSVNDKHEIFVSGRIDMTNVKVVCAGGKLLIDTLGTVNINLSGVEYADSSSLAMLIDWIRCAKLQHKDVVLHNLPRFMLDLGRVCGLDAILPIDRPLKFNN
jgi:anti-anti-sigma factor